MKSTIFVVLTILATSGVASANSMSGTCIGSTDTGEALKVLITTNPDVTPVTLQYQDRNIELNPLGYAVPDLPYIFMSDDRQFVFEQLGLCGKSRLVLPDGSTAVLSCRIDGACGQ